MIIFTLFPSLKLFDLLEVSSVRLPPLRITCGRCGMVLWERLEEYCQAQPCQSHIAKEIYTRVPPLLQSTTTSEHGVKNPLLAFLPQQYFNAIPTKNYQQMAGAQLNCANNCHKRQWLIDHKSGMIHYGAYEYGVACGQGTEQHFLFIILTITSSRTGACCGNTQTINNTSLSVQFTSF